MIFLATNIHHDIHETEETKFPHQKMNMYAFFCCCCFNTFLCFFSRHGILIYKASISCQQYLPSELHRSHQAKELEQNGRKQLNLIKALYMENKKNSWPHALRGVYFLVAERAGLEPEGEENHNEPCHAVFHHHHHHCCRHPQHQGK